MNSIPSVRNDVNGVVTQLHASLACNTSMEGVFDVAEEIQRLCNSGLASPRVALTMHAVEAPSSAPSRAPDLVERPIDWTALKGLSSPEFLTSIVESLYQRSEQPTMVVVTTQTGHVVHSAQRGWKGSEFHSHARSIAKLARECIWGKCPLVSNEMFFESPTLRSDTDHRERSQWRCSVNLNRMAQSIGNTPLVAQSFPLPQSSGFAIVVGATSQSIVRDAQGIEPWIAPIDAWLIVRRSTPLTKLLAMWDRLRTRPHGWITAILGLIAILSLPIPYYPRRDCVFEPESKQFLASPIQGRISSCEVRPGAIVEKGQLMARIDDDQLVRDLATASAELDGARKKRDSALATKNASNYGLAELDFKQASLRVESISQQLQRLEVRSPADGIVVQGDWQRSIGVPVTLGQTLFEVAELKSMTAEVRLTAFDLSNINIGDSVSIRSDSSAGMTFRGRISRIEPRATIVDDKAVFAADVVIEDPDRQLRPGMKANAQITAGWKSVGWLLFNRPYRWIANQWIW